MPGTVKKKVVLADEAKKMPSKKSDGGASAPPSSPAPVRKGGKKKDGKGRKKKPKKPQLSPEEQRRLEVAKWTSVRPQMLAERIAQDKIEMPYFLQIEYALMADKALAKREQEAKDKLDQAVEQKQSQDREHLIEVTERHQEWYEQRFQRALENWVRVENKMDDLEKRQMQKMKDINSMLYLRKQEACKRFKEQERLDKQKFNEEARIARILSKKYY